MSKTVAVCQKKHVGLLVFWVDELLTRLQYLIVGLDLFLKNVFGYT